jgi:hypothetical protein
MSSEPRNVTPDEAFPGGKPADPAVPSEATTGRLRTADEYLPSSWDRQRGGFPVLGVLLVVIGAGLFVQFVFPQVSAGTLILLALGAAFLGAWLTGRSWFAMVPGFMLLALGLAELIEDLALIKPAQQDVPGLSATALAIAFLVIWLVARVGNRRWMWPLWAAAIFAFIGLPQLATLVVLPEVGGALVPVVIIVLGFIVLFNWRRERA